MIVVPLKQKRSGVKFACDYQFVPKIVHKRDAFKNVFQYFYDLSWLNAQPISIADDSDQGLRYDRSNFEIFTNTYNDAFSNYV